MASNRPSKSLRWLGEQLVERGGAAFAGLGQDHLLDDGQTLGFEEHVLGPAQTDALRPVHAAPARTSLC